MIIKLYFTVVLRRPSCCATYYILDRDLANARKLRQQLGRWAKAGVTGVSCWWWLASVHYDGVGSAQRLGGGAGVAIERSGVAARGRLV